MLPDRKARLLLVSSQASPPSSQLSFQRPTANLIDSMVCGLFKTTVLPSASTSLPPQDPKIRVPPAGRIAERVTGVLTDRPAAGLQFLAGFTQGVPGIGEGIVPDLLKPRLAIGDQPAANGPRHADPFVADRGNELRDLVVAALSLANLIGYVTGIGEAFGVELRPISDRHHDVQSAS